MYHNQVSSCRYPAGHLLLKQLCNYTHFSFTKEAYLSIIPDASDHDNCSALSSQYFPKQVLWVSFKYNKCVTAFKLNLHLRLTFKSAYLAAFTNTVVCFSPTETLFLYRVNLMQRSAEKPGISVKAETRELFDSRFSLTLQTSIWGLKWIDLQINKWSYKTQKEWIYIMPRIFLEHQR